MYDPKCNHKLLTFSVGMRIFDGHQARDALTYNIVLNGWHIHFKRARRRKLKKVSRVLVNGGYLGVE